MATPRDPVERTDRDLLSRAIVDSGLSIAAFSRATGRGHDGRLLRAWLAGETPIPVSYADYLRCIIRVTVTATTVAVLVER